MVEKRRIVRKWKRKKVLSQRDSDLGPQAEMDPQWSLNGTLTNQGDEVRASIKSAISLKPSTRSSGASHDRTCEGRSRDSIGGVITTH